MGNMHIITGYRGSNHVTSDDVGSFNAAIFGTGAYVLERGSKLVATVETNNRISITDGELMFQGRHVRLTSSVALTIENGVTGYKRNDLIVARYTKNSDNVEDVNLVVIKGTNSSGTPTDPSYINGNIINHATTADMPLYRIPIDGINVGTPEKLFHLAGLELPIADRSISNFKLVLGSITANELASNAVTTAKITNGNVTTEKIKDGAVSKTFEVTTGTTWSTASTGAFYQDVTCTGMLATYRPIADLKLASNATLATIDQAVTDWSKVFKIDTKANAIRVYCTEKPVGTMTISMMVVLK